MTTAAISPADIKLLSILRQDKQISLVNGLTNALQSVKEWPTPMRELIAKNPSSLKWIVLGSAWSEAIYQIMQEITLQLIPKLITGFFKISQGTLEENKQDLGQFFANLSTHPEQFWSDLQKIGSKTAIIAADDMAIEAPEYAALYIGPTATGIISAKFLVDYLLKSLKIPHFELLGKRIYELEKSMGKEIEVGTLNPKKVFINQELIRNVSFAKSMNFLGVVGTVIFSEIIAAAIRPLFTNWLFKTSNFYDISGLQTDDTEKNDGTPALKQAKKNILDSLIGIVTSLGTAFGLSWIFTKLGLHKGKFFTEFAKRFDFNDKFGLSRILAAVSLIPSSAFGYNTVARKLLEAKDNLFRMFVISWFCILGFKPGVGNILGGSVGLANGINVVSNPFKTWYDGVVGKNAGLRDPLDINFIDLYKNKSGEYEGKVAEMVAHKFPSLEKQKSLLKTIDFAKNKAPLYFVALPFGLFVAYFINFQRTVDGYKSEKDLKHGKRTESTHYSGIRGWLEDIVDKAARYFYGIQQKNFVSNSVSNSSTTQFNSSSSLKNLLSSPSLSLANMPS